MYSMLDGDALTAVEHLEFPEFAIEGGENVILTILEARYPDKDPIDRAGKALFDVFEVSAREGEPRGVVVSSSATWELEQWCIISNTHTHPGRPGALCRVVGGFGG